ncbi:MAG TPA: hypothetical protein VII13_22155 [Vicinamibacteria bacterium]|jgi:membrane protein implicated in regulation of membrane protease activity
MKQSRTNRAGVALLASLALLSVACRETTVSKLLAEPQKYANEDVGLKGDVVESVSVLGRGAYQLDDGTGTIWVVSTKGVPRKGARVAVRGRVRDVANLGDLVPLPPQVGSGLVLVSDEHKGI